MFRETLMVRGDIRRVHWLVTDLILTGFRISVNLHDLIGRSKDQKKGEKVVT